MSALMMSGANGVVGFRWKVGEIGDTGAHKAPTPQGTADFADWLQIEGVLAHAGRRGGKFGGLEAWKFGQGFAGRPVRGVPFSVLRSPGVRSTP